MTYYKLLMSYKGTHFYGWQRQKGNRPTVQSHLEDCLLNIYKGEEVKTLASGRTDAGVHALGQTVRLTVPWDIPCGDLKNALNALLMPDVRILQVLPADSSFHPIRDALWKEYCYLFSLAEGGCGSFWHEMIASVGYGLDVAEMMRSAKAFEGQHDFCNYRTTGGSSKTTCKRIFECEIVSGEAIFPLMASHPIFMFRVKGEGFLKQMVRLMMGAIIEVGRGRVSSEDIKRSLQAPTRAKLGAVAPSCGLYLREVFYEKP